MLLLGYIIVVGSLSTTFTLWSNLWQLVARTVTVAVRLKRERSRIHLLPHIGGWRVVDLVGGDLFCVSGSRCEGSIVSHIPS